MSDSHSYARHEGHDIAAESLLQIKQKSVDHMHLQPGQRVLDVGCGTGDDTLALAQVIGKDGIVHGVDYDATMIAKARQRAGLRVVAGRVSYHHANAAALPWPDGYFDATRSDRILQQMLDPAHAFDELLRVTRPGGRVVVISGDWATLDVDIDDANIESRHAYFTATLVADSALSGCCLRSMFTQRGLLDLHFEVRSAFRAADDTNGGWQRSIAPEAAASGLFASANVVMIAGRKP